MDLAPGETQIAKGPRLTVTDRRIACEDGEIAVNTVSAPQIEERLVQVSVAKTVIGIGANILIAGFIVRAPLLWISGAAICAFGALARVKRRSLVVTVEAAGARRPLFTATNLEEARLACAAVEEALRRSAA
jgi:hypothetical protein